MIVESLSLRSALPGYPLTNFVLQPVELVESEDETQLTADFVTGAGTFRKTMLTTDFTSAQRFKGMLNKTGIDLGYFGGDADLELFKVFLADLDWKHKRGVKAAGIYTHGGRIRKGCFWRFCTTLDCVAARRWDSNGVTSTLMRIRCTSSATWITPAPPRRTGA